MTESGQEDPQALGRFQRLKNRLFRKPVAPTIEEQTYQPETINNRNLKDRLNKIGETSPLNFSEKQAGYYAMFRTPDGKRKRFGGFFVMEQDPEQAEKVVTYSVGRETDPYNPTLNFNLGKRSGQVTSRLHAVIQIKFDSQRNLSEAKIADLGSLNGTYGFVASEKDPSEKEWVKFPGPENGLKFVDVAFSTLNPNGDLQDRGTPITFGGEYLTKLFLRMEFLLEEYALHLLYWNWNNTSKGLFILSFKFLF